MFNFHRAAPGVTPNDVAEAIKLAVADATNTVTLTNHMAQCIEDKAEIKASLLRQERDRASMHAENQVRFTKIERMIYMAVGAWMVISLFFTEGGGLLISKLIH